MNISSRLPMACVLLCTLLLGSGEAISSRTSAHSTAASPNRPYPQHTTYTAGTIKPNNVTQQQLDDSVRTFYDRWKTRYLKHDCGSDRYYVYFESGQIICVSEGQGYGMLITALMAGYDANARTYFDGLYQFYRAHPSSINDRLMAWKQIAGCITDPSDGTDAATDGDMDIAFGLLLAHEQWGSSGTINYLQEANALIDAIMQDEINHETWSTKLGDWAMPPEPNYYYGTRTSDFMTDHFRIFQQATGDTNWSNVVEECYSLVGQMQSGYSPTTGLLPDFIVHTNTSPAPASANYLEASTDGSYSYNACRDPWRIATDYLMSGDARAKNALDKLNAWIHTHTGGDPAHLWAGYRLNGTDVPGNHYNAESFSGPFAVSAMVDPGNQQWLNDLWAFNVTAYNFDSAFYYENTLKLLTMIVVSGNWWQPEFERAIEFSGYRWNVKTSADPVGPGPNYFSLSSENVWVDTLGQLHLRIMKRNNRWYCGEVSLDTSLGYGRYVFSTRGNLGVLDENAVLGLFTWDDDSAQAHREIDIECSRWGDASDTTNAQFVVQPWDVSGNLVRWSVPAAMDSSTLSFNWRHDSISFLSVGGHKTFPPYQEVNAAWRYTGSNIPSPGNERADINLWLYQGMAPSDSQEIEVIISKFEFNPIPPPVHQSWRMVSLSRTVADANAHSLFSNLISGPFWYDPLSGYQSIDTLANGFGYWIRVSGDSVSAIAGDSILTDTIPVEEGWNMVGSISTPVPVASIASEPGGMITSSFYAYDGSYRKADTISPGMGYWVKVQQAGSLVLSAPMGSVFSVNAIRIVADGAPPPLPPHPAEEIIPPTTKPLHFFLGQNYPNPFNPTTNFGFQISNSGFVSVKMYDVLGREVATAFNGEMEAGFHTVEFDGSHLPSGVYFYRIVAGHFVETKKMLLLK